MIELLIAGITLGLYAGFSPGPLLVLVISQTLKHGCKEGVKVAFAPIITDLPIIVVTVLFLSLISSYTSILGVISILGGVYLGYMAYESFKTRGLTENIDVEKPKSFQKGATVNFLNPSPYLFWITIGGPIIINAYSASALSPFLFIIGFYALLVSSKIALAYATSKSRDFLTGKTYIYTMRTLGVVLLIFALYFLNQGVHLLIK
ncbi:MAG: LysE family translocator [Methanobacterium sp.]|uniref:LysE family translocator n=1 Tax=Methanobacterium sp. TaxID=2164 RepID=UPI003D65F107|nr:LysE family translocator [Methanobacterium sp.]